MHGFTSRWLLAACCIQVALNSPAVARISAEAIPGAPFGIASVTIPLEAGDSVALQNNAFTVTEADGRVYYPTFTNGAVRRILGGLLGGGEAENATSTSAVFLFKGEAPLRLTISTTRKHSIVVTPRRGSLRSFNRLMRNWWREYNAAARKQVADGDYPPIVETYLTAMLGKRLGLDPPLLSRINNSQSSELQQSLELLLGVEKLRLATMRDTILNDTGFVEPVDRPLPRNVLWALPDVRAKLPDADVEEIAMRVPEECFYVRFGTFENYLWMNSLIEEFAADASRMISVRGHESAGAQQIQRQLAVKKTKVSDIFGPSVVAEIAIIGRDLYMRDGAAFGILFRAKSNALLIADIEGNRAAALKENKEKGATNKTVKIAGHDVSFLSTPDNSVRSYYFRDGEYHLVTNSKEIMRRFFEVKDGKNSLGESFEFQNARRWMPQKRDDTIFVYLSSAFMRGLVSPQYQIELARRIKSGTDMELIEIAKLAARAEGQPHRTIDDLVAGGFLPRGFGVRPDGSGPILTADGVIDSMRGARGTFTPIPDVPLRGVTRSEESLYISRSAYYAANWKQIDPVMVGVKRFKLDDKGKERLVVDANVATLGEEKYGWLFSLLGPPTKEKIATVPGDVISAQMSVKGGLLLPSIPPHYLFGGVQDTAPPMTDLQPTGFFKVLQILQSTPGYIGAWPKPGFLDLLPFGLAGTPDEFGYTRMLFGLWRRQFAGFSLLSFQRGVLEDVSPHLRVEEADTLAQIRINVGDLHASKLNGWLTTMNYQRAMQTSLGNVRLLHMLTQQLNVPREDALKVSEKLLGVHLTCSLGGKYETKLGEGGVTTWQSSKLPVLPVTRVPVDYKSPILEWFRGLNVELTKVEDRMMVRAHIDMQRKATASAVKLPSFNIFGSKKPKPKDAKPKEPEKPAPPKKPSKGPREF